MRKWEREKKKRRIGNEGKQRDREREMIESARKRGGEVEKRVEMENRKKEREKK